MSNRNAIFERRHYVVIAEVLRGLRCDDAFAGNQWRSTIQNLADMFQSDNPRFDRNRFINACL